MVDRSFIFRDCEHFNWVYSLAQVLFILYLPFLGMAQSPSATLLEKIKPILTSPTSEITFEKQFLQGIILDNKTKEPVIYAPVEIVEINQVVYTNEQGVFECSFFDSNHDLSLYTLRVNHGYYTDLENVNAKKVYVLHPSSIAVKKSPFYYHGCYEVIYRYDPNPARKTGIWSQFNTFKMNENGVWHSKMQ